MSDSSLASSDCLTLVVTGFGDSALAVSPENMARETANAKAHKLAVAGFMDLAISGM
jgi:hypothetical protein